MNLRKESCKQLEENDEERRPLMEFKGNFENAKREQSLCYEKARMSFSSTLVLLLQHTVDGRSRPFVDGSLQAILGTSNARLTADGRSRLTLGDKVQHTIIPTGYVEHYYMRATARVEGTSPDPTPNVFPFPERLPDSAWEWLANRSSLNMIIEKSFGEEVIEHFRLENLFRGLGWIPLLYLSGDYYPDLVREFCATMLHKTDNDLPIIIFHVKGVRIFLERDRLASILMILDNGNTVTVDSNRRSIDEEPDWNFDAACSCFNIRPRDHDHRRIIHEGDFPSLLPRVLTYFFGHTLVKKENGLSEVCIVDMYLLDKLYRKSPLSLSSLIIHMIRNTGCDSTKNTTIINRALKSDSIHNIQQLRLSMGLKEKGMDSPAEEDKLWDRSAGGFRPIRKTTQSGIGASS
ncbi:hypothetical protein M9H77_13972 [Catharanthus roseus]|uniref:Uncharacterized protein n=1 Tax=Catharanthus roseus TaxID=4058 RepID=A0ACC0BLU9_CATRO|nr:hypothetical protein M9H77_13972 [Catharanthus roseus]